MPTLANDNKDKLPIACINIDYILKHYTLAQSFNKTLEDKIIASKVTIEQKRMNLEKQVAEFQNKLNENAFLSEISANEEYEKIKKAGSDIETFVDSTETDFKKQKLDTNRLIEGLITSEIKEYNRNKKYQIIYNSSGLSNILYADEKYDATSDFLEFINQRAILEQ